MEGEPKPDRKIISREDALALVRADSVGWQDAQIWTLEDYLVRRAEEQLSSEEREIFQERLRDIGDYTLKGLTALGEAYNLLPDFDLETEALKVYCRRRGLELSP